jgi:hypothetical protein
MRVGACAELSAFRFGGIKGFGNEMRTAEHVKRHIILRWPRQDKRHMPIETAGKIKPRLQPAFKGCVSARMYHDRFHHHFLFICQNRPTRIDAIECRPMPNKVFD